MRTITGDAPNSIENQSVIDIMYRAWFFILSIGILLPMRWLPHLLPKPSKIAFPAVATAALISCGELMLANPTVTPPGPYCPGATIQISFTGTNLPEGDNIEVFIDDISTYNPFMGGGSSIGTIPIDYSCSTCPAIMAVMLNPATCSGANPNDEQNEFMVLGSGCGFNVSNFQLNPSVGGAGVNDSIGGSQGCQWSLANATAAANFLIANGTNCTGNIFPAGPSTQIPGGAIVIAFNDAFGPNIPYNFQSLCATGMPIYILSSSCDRLLGGYSNVAASAPGYTLTTCSPPTTQFSYSTPPTPSNSGVNNIIALGGASFVSTSGCTDPGLSSLNFPDIPIATATLNYTIPAGVCGSGTGLMNFYMSGLIDINAPCADIVYTPPSALSIAVSCPVDIVAVGPFCSNGAPVQLTVTGSMGPGTWSGGPYISSTGVFDPSLASIGNNTVTYTEAPCGSVNEIIVVNSPPVINEDFIPSATTCAGDASGQIVNSSFITGGTAPYTYDWDYQDVPGNEVYPDDGNTFFPHGLNGVYSGFYDFIVTDALGCSDVATVYVPEGDPVTATFQIDPILCFGGMTGGIQITSSNGPPVSGIIYNWDDLSIPGDDDFGGPPAVDDDLQNISGLGAGSYAVTITYEDPGFFLCTFDTILVITEPAQLTLLSPDVALPCFGNTGTLTATPGGGTPGYIYNWSHIGGSSNPPPWAPVIAGNYIITVTDANGCSIVDVVAVTQPSAALTAMATGEAIDCDDNTGDITLTVSGGTIPYLFDWDNDGTGDNDDPQNLSGLNSGTYSVTVTDANGCTAVASATITLNPPTFTMPPDDGSTVPCISDAQVQPIPPPWDNSCGDPLTITGPNISPDPICEGLKTYTFTYTDPATNNSAQWVYTYTIDYSAGLVAPPNGSLTVSCPANATDPGAPANILDACGNSLTAVLIGSVINPNPITCDGSVVWTYRYTACDNSTVDWTFTYTVDYSGTLTPPANGSSTVTCSFQAIDPGAPANITDACGRVLTPALVGSVSTPDPITCDGTVIWTYRYTACDNSTADWTYTYTVNFSGGLVAPPNGSSSVACPAAAVDPGAPANIMDACGNTLIPVLIGSVSNPNPIICDGTVVWTYRYTACDNSTVDWTYTYTVDYSGTLTPPANGSSTVVCPADAVDPGAPANILDACGNSLTPVLVGSTSTPNPITCDGTVVWTYRYTACDNSTADWTYTYTVDYSGTLTPPANGSSTVACPADATNPGAPASIMDACGRTLNAVLIGSVSNPNPITCDGSVVWTYRYTACDNSTVDWTYTYTIDYSGTLSAPPAGSSTVSCSFQAVNPGAPATITDACGRVLTAVLVGSVSTPDPITCDGTVVWTYRYTACDNSTVDWTYTYTVNFSTGLMPPANGSSTVACAADAVNPGAPSNILDACGNTLIPVLIGSVSTPDPITCDGTVVWTYRYTACDASTADWTYTYTVDYSGTLTPPANGSSTVACPADAVDPGAPANILDACGNSLTPMLVGSTSNPNPITCNGTVVWTYRYTACDNSTADWTYTYTVVYSSSLMPPANGSSMVTCPSAATDPGAPANITDACGNIITPMLVGSVSNPNPITCDGTVVWTYRYTACDNSTADWTYTYTVDYSGALVPPANGSSTVSCPADAINPGAPANITDACGRVLAPVLIGSVSNPDPITCDGSVVWTYRYTACDNSTVDWTYTYTVDYSGTLAPPANGSSNVSCSFQAVDPGAPADITDACGRVLTPVLIGSVSTPDPITCDGTVVWTYRYTACDNSTADWTYTYTVNFSSGLVAPPNGSSTVACPADAIDPGAPANILDACGNTLTPTLVGSVSNPNPIICDGTVVWTYRYTACDNSTVDWTYTYTVDYSGTLTPPANGSSTVACPADAVDPGAPANILDACGNSLTPVLVGSTSNPNPIICDGTIVWTYRYTACDNSTADRTYTYTVDYSGTLTPPANGSSTVACPADATDPGAPASIMDACGRTLNAVLVGSVSNPNPIICDGSVVWTYRYTACDNTTVDWTYTYTIDYSGTLNAPPAGSSTVSCSFQAVDPGAPADITDACGRVLTAVLIGSVSTPDPITCDGTVVWTYRYTACDNSTVDWTYTYTVNFSTGLMPPANGSSTVDCAADAVNPGAPANIIDACGNTLIPVLIGSVSTPDPITCDGTVVWTYQYTACDGSTADWTYTYTVDYSGTLTPPANGSSTALCPADAVDPGAPANILDACGNSLTPVLVGSTSNPNPITCEGSVIWTYRYTACDNSTADWTYTYTIDYTGSLVPPANGSSTVNCAVDAVDPGAPANIIDACGNIITPVLVGSVSNPNPITCDGTVVWTYRYTACDNSTADWTYTYTVDYSSTLTPPANGSSTVACPGDATDPGAPANIMDACGNTIIPVLIGSVSNPDPITCDGAVVWTYRYTACDNSTVDWTYTYTIDYSGTLTPPANGSSNVSCSFQAVDPGFPANITDACGRVLTPVLIGSVSTPDPITCDGTVVWTYRYTACDNSTVDWTYTYTISFIGGLVAPPNGSSTVACPVDAIDPGAPANIMDACGNTLIPALVGSVSTPDPITCDGTVVWTYRYTACDNSTVDWTYTYTVDYSGTLTPPSNGSSTIACPADAIDPGAPANILDACGNSLTPVLVGSTSNPNPIICDGTIVWTYRYTACDNSTADWTYTYTVDYSGTLTPPANGSSTVACPADATDPGAPASIMDACGRTLNAVLVGSVSNPNPITCDGTVIWTYRYTACDNSTVDWTYTYTIDYSGTLTPPANGSSTVSCSIQAVDPGAPANITDACGRVLSAILIGSISTPDPITCDGMVVWTYRYTACDNSTVDWTYTYTVNFSSGLMPPANGSSTVACAADAVDPGAPANIMDACGNTLVPVLIGSVSTPDPITCDGTMVWTYQYTACDGSTADWTYTYTVDYSGTLTPPANGSSTVTCAADAVDPGAPANILDACGNSLTPVLVGSTSNPNPITCEGTVVWTYRYTACDNSTTDWTYTYTVDYTGSLVPPADGSSTVDCAVDAVDPGAPADIIDACGNSLSPVLIGSVSNPDPITCDGTVVWTYRYTACDNSTVDWTFTYTIDYNSTLTPPANGSSSITCPGDAVDPGAPADIVDACGNTISPVLIGSVSNPDPIVCNGTIVWTYQYTACDNSTVDWTYTYTINDNIFPTASNPAPLTVDCIGDIPAPDINIITDEADNCPGTITVDFVSDASDGGTCPETITRTYSVTDACGNEILVTQVITVDDDVLPTASNPAPVDVECVGDVPVPDVNAVTDEADNCPGTITVAFVSDMTTGGPCPEIITRTYSVTDACGNQILVTQTITINDITPPTASSPAPVTVDCVGDVPAPDVNDITDEADNCPAAIIVAFVGDVSDGATCPETITRTYSVTDACGNVTLVTQTITVDDDVLPTASNPGPLTVDCIGDVPAPDVNLITDEADNCPGVITVAFVGDVSDGGLCPETITRTYSVTDACGNQILVTQVITVDDDVLPTASSPAPLTVDCVGDIPAPDINAITDEADNCPGVITVAFVGDVSDGGLCPETITRTYSVTDACGNQILVTQVITVDDDVLPTASNPAPIDVECVGDVPAPDVNAVTDEADNCPGTLTVAFVSDMTTGGPCPEIITRTYSVTDACGNQILVTQTITINDITPPTASSPAPVTVDCVGDVPAPDVNDITDEADNCPAAIVVAFVGDVSDGATCPETITRTYSVTDACGNVTLVTQTITVDDDVLPTASNPGPLTVDCIGDIPAPDVNLITDEADNCPGTITVAFVGDVSDGGLCPETITRTYSVTDACGNQILVTQVITVDDDVLPTASSPTPLTVDCIGDIPAPDVNVITDEADNCLGAITVDFVSDASDGGTCPETITRTYSVTDACGNSILVNQIITVDDDVLPTASSPAPVSVDCVGDVPAPDVNAVTDEADNCPGVITVAFVNDVSSGGPCPEIITRTYSVTDACGNQTLVTQMITINDITPPTASSPAPVTVDCVSDVPAPDVNVITDEADNCPAALVVAFVSDVTDGATCPETITRTYSITDGCGNITLVTQTITVDDDVLPTASNPGPLTVDCIGDVPAPDVNLITDEADNCPGTITVAFVGDVSDGGLCPETITRTYSVTDACGNQILVTQTITVDDDVLPTASSPAPLTVDCIGDIPAPDVNVITDEADNCPGALTVDFVLDASDGGTCPETITRTYSVTDACGNSILINQIITVDDDILPTASSPAPVSVDCVDDVPAPDVNAVTDEADNCPGLITVAFVNDVSSGGPCPEIITRTYSVTDACGNQTLVTQMITINDITPPTASSPAPVTVDCAADVPAPDVNVITDEADNCPAAIVVAFVGDVSDGGICPETITRTYSVTDACGNVTLVTQSILVDDDVLPTASNLAPLTADCIGDVPAPDINLVTDEADNCPGTITVAFVGDVSDGGSCPETITRTYSVTDACGNQILVTQTITVDDNILPTASNPAPLTADCSGSIPLPDVNVVTDEADNCPAPITVAFVSDVSDGGSCPETVTRTYSVTDACGNQILVTQTITVGDVTPPTASNPEPVNVECIGDVPAPDVNVVTDETDNCAGALTVAFVNDVSNGGPCPEVITRTYSITDACGNQILVTQTITINDITPPTASNPAPVTVDCVVDVPVADVTVVTDESDNCIAPVVVAFVGDVPDGASCPLTITRTYSITDACGNQNLVTQTITVNDITPPTASNPSPIIVSGCNTAVPAPDISYVTDAADNCSPPVVAFVSDVADLVGCTETTTRTFSVTDACNNSITVEQLITRTVDNTPPVFTNPPADISVDCIAQVPAMAPLDYTDNCSMGGSIVGVETGPSGDPLTIIREWTVTDDCGNVATETQIITITQLNGSGMETYTGCLGDGYSVIVNGTTYDESNPMGTETFPGPGGCDSTVTIDLTFNPTSTGTETYNGCVGDGYSVNVNGTVYNEGNPDGIEVLTNSFGCDSTVTISLNFELTTSGNENYTGCTGDGYSVVVGPTTYNELNPTGTETLTGINGCDSIVTVLLIFNPTSTGTETYTGCQGDGYSVVVNGTTYDESNPNGTEVLTGFQGCDSTVTITLVFAPAGFGAENYLGCEGDGYSIVVNGTTYDEVNPTGIETFPGPGGCDSTVNINLIFNPLGFGSETYNGCEGDGYSVVVNGTTYNEANPDGTEVLQTMAGCDSTVTIDLNFLPTTTGDETYTGCEGDGYSVVVNGTIYDETNPSGTETLTGINGCDSVVTILLTFAPAGNGTETYNGCEGDGYSVVVNGTTYDESNPVGTEVFPGGGGCDSTVQINLVFNPITFGNETYNGCTGDGYSIVVNGTIYNEGNPTGTETLTGPNGCDSIVDINLMFSPILEGEELYTGCEGDGYSVVVNGTVYDESNPDGIEVITGSGCDSIVTIDLDFAPFMPADITVAGPYCTEAGIQTLTASPPGGTWSGSVTSNQFDPALLGPGTHEVIYTTPAGPCQSADTIDIVVYELVISCLTIQDETAPMANDGQGQVTVSGGVPNYTVTWTGPASGSVVLMADGDFIISSLPPGTYTVEVTDATGCTTTCQFTIENAIPCDLSIDDIIVQEATCSGVDNGTATIIVSGTMVPFEYALDGGTPVSTNVFTMLAAGPHTIVVTDAAGCMDVQNFLVTTGQGPSLAEGVTVDASCGECNGSIDVVVNGGAPPYNYSIDGVMYGLSSLFPGLCAGTYDIYLIDDGGCTDTLTLVVAETDAPVITSIDIGGSSCGQSDGSITINATGGLPPLEYSINGGNTFQSSNFFDGHPAGVYPVVVRDAAGCETTGTATITDVGAPAIDLVITTETSCGTFDGTITINASGGAPPLMYSITGGAPFQSSNFFEFLPAGNYDIVVRDANGCQAIDMVTLNTTDGPVITNVVVTHTSCGEENGEIEIMATGGTGDLMYSIDGGNTFQSSNIFDMLEEGDYDIVVIDESNCPVTDQATIDDSEAPELDVYYTLAHCGKADGQLEVEGNGGTPPYMYSINGGAFTTNNVFVNLISDFYTLAVKDANDCIFEIDVLLEDDDLPEITNVITTDPPCGMTNGSIEIEATGDGLQYSILTPAVYQASPIFDPVTPGTYTINVRDQYGCFAVPASAVINPMPNPAFTTVVVDSECGMNSGSIEINATSGTMPYLYSIGGPFVATDIFTGLAAGTYTVTVRDDNNCEVSGDVVINSVGTQTGMLDTSICDGAEIIIDGNIFNTAGTYNIQISGGASNGCDSTLTLTLGIDPLLEKEFQDSICVGEIYTYNGIDYTLPGQYVVDTIPATVGCDTILILDLIVNPLDTTYIDTFICTGGVFTINGMDYTMTGDYVIDTIPATIGCDSVRILRLVVNDLNELTVSEEICEGETFTINGMDYTLPGLYTIDTLAGPGGCDTILFLDLVVNPLPTANAGADLTLDCDVITVTLNGSATGGSPLWTGPDINPGNETQLMPEVSLPGTYVLTVTSAEGCMAIDSVVVNLDPESVIANAGIDDSLSCDITQITLQGSPLGPDYTYQWTGPGIDATNENLPNPTITEGGTYTLVVTNTVTQCVSAPDEVVISDISAILIAIIQDPVSFNCYIDSIDLEAVGSSTGPNIVYAWFDAEGNLIANTPGLEITSGGMFTLIVEDTVSGCFDKDSVMVEDLTQYPQVDAGLPQSIDCDSPTALLNEGATNNNNNVVFQWTSTLGGIVGPDTLITAVVNIPGQYYYLMATDTTNGCQNQDSVFVTDMTQLPLADINIAEIITCIDETALLNVGNSSSGPGIMYVWSGPDLNNIVSETLETSVPGQYYLDVINETTGCASRDTALLVAPMEPQDLMATIELPLCEGDPSGTITIDSVTGGTPVYMYSINGGAPQTSPTFEDLYAGVYSIAVVDANGCVYAESYTVAEGIQLTIDIGPDIDLVLGDSVTLWADVSLPWSQIDSIVWTPIDILSCTYCINPVLYGLQSDVVTATVYSGGCVDQDMLNVRVDVDANIYIPNVFSPNDDGINDYVTIFTDHRVRRIVYFEIFDRWGNQVFVGENFLPNDPLKGWDGSFKGKVMNPAVFAYIARVELINGDQVDRKGDITIVR